MQKLSQFYAEKQNTNADEKNKKELCPKLNVHLD